MKERIQKLVDELNQYRKEYYTQDQPTVSDSEYDKLYRELVELEKALKNINMKHHCIVYKMLFHVRN